MRFTKLTLVCLLALGFCFCNNKNNRNSTNVQEIVCTDSSSIDTGSQKNVNSEYFEKEFIKIYTMKKYGVVFGDVYVKFEKNSLFRYLYVVNNGDTLYSIKNGVFLNKDGIVDIEIKLNKIGLNDFGGYRFSVINFDYL